MAAVVTEKVMTVAQMRVVMNKYKRDTCPPMPKTKTAMIKVLKILKLPTTMPKPVTREEKLKMKRSKSISNMTRRDLIENIAMLNKEHKSTYNDWSKRDLFKLYSNLRKNEDAKPRVPGVMVEGPNYQDALAEIDAEAQRGPSAAVLAAFKRKKKK